VTIITFWLVVSLSIAAGDWQIMENVQQPDLESCLSAVASRVERAEQAQFHEEDGSPSRREYEIAVTCSIHKSPENPA